MISHMEDYHNNNLNRNMGDNVSFTLEFENYDVKTLSVKMWA